MSYRDAGQDYNCVVGVLYLPGPDKVYLHKEKQPHDCWLEIMIDVLNYRVLR